MKCNFWNVTKPRHIKYHRESFFFSLDQEFGLIISQIITDWPRSEFKTLECTINEKKFRQLSTVDLGMGWKVSSKWVIQDWNHDDLMVRSPKKWPGIFRPPQSMHLIVDGGTANSNDDLRLGVLVAGELSSGACVDWRRMELSILSWATMRGEKEGEWERTQEREKPMGRKERMALIGPFKITKKLG